MHHFGKTTGLGLLVCVLLSGCAANDQAASEWWGEGDGAFRKSSRSPFGDPNAGKGWNPFSQQNKPAAPPLPWQRPAPGGSGMNMPNTGYPPPPPPTMPPAPYGGYEGLNPPAQAPGNVYNADPYAVAPVPPGVLNPDTFPMPAPVNPGNGAGLYQPQSYSPPPPAAAPVPGEVADFSQQNAYFSQPLNGNALTPEARAQQRFQNVAAVSPPAVAVALPTMAPAPAMVNAALPAEGDTLIRFEGGGTRVSAENDALLKQAAERYGQTGYRLLVEGQPTSNTPESIAQARAQAGTVARYLISYGIATTGVIISTGTPGGTGNTVAVRAAPYL